MRTTIACAMTHSDQTPGSRERLQNTANVVETSNHKIWSRTANTVTAYLLHQIQLLAHRDRHGLAHSWGSPAFRLLSRLL